MRLPAPCSSDADGGDARAADAQPRSLAVHRGGRRGRGDCRISRWLVSVHLRHAGLLARTEVAVALSHGSHM